MDLLGKSLPVRNLQNKRWLFGIFGLEIFSVNVSCFKKWFKKSIPAWCFGVCFANIQNLREKKINDCIIPFRKFRGEVPFSYQFWTDQVFQYGMVLRCEFFTLKKKLNLFAYLFIRMSKWGCQDSRNYKNIWNFKDFCPNEDVRTTEITKNLKLLRIFVQMRMSGQQKLQKIWNF